MSTFLIETTEQDSFLAVVRYVAGLLQEKSELKTSLAATPSSQLVNDAEQFVASGQYGSLLGLLLQHVDLIFKETEAPNTGCCINIICHLVPRVEPPSASVKAAADLADALASKPEHRSGEKLQAMLELFNTLVLPDAQHAVLRKALVFAKANKLASLAPPLRGKAELWASQWGLSNEEAIQLYIACADVLALHPSPVLTKEAFLLKNKALASCRAQDSASLSALKATANSAALEFIASPSLFSWDLVNTPVVRQLKDDKAYAKTYALLNTMLTGGLKQFRSEDFGDVLSRAGISKEDCLDKMRLMALVALGSKHEGEDLAFKAIEAELDLQPGDAEAWLVRAFGKGLLDGRIDQVRECVSVRRCERRVFEKSDWQRLLDDLSMWKENVANLSTTMKNSKLLTPTCTVEPWIAS